MSVQLPTHLYYFDPLTQTHRLQGRRNDSVSVELHTREEIPERDLRAIIQNIGNYTVLVSLEKASKDTESKPCVSYQAHAFTCERGNLCKRHLTKEELAECRQMGEHLTPLLPNIQSTITNLEISLGNVDRMRDVLAAVRKAVQSRT